MIYCFLMHIATGTFCLTESMDFTESEMKNRCMQIHGGNAECTWTLARVTTHSIDSTQAAFSPSRPRVGSSTPLSPSWSLRFSRRNRDLRRRRAANGGEGPTGAAVPPSTTGGPGRPQER